MKTTIVILCSLMATAHSAHAGLHWWFSDGDLGPLEDAELVEITGKGGHTGDMVAIYKATEARTDDGAWYKNLVVRDDFSVAGKGDTLVFESVLFNAGGWRYIDVDDVPLEAGCHYYTVLFDSPHAGVAVGTESIVLDKVTFLATGNADYEVFTEGQNAGIQWNTIQAAPDLVTLRMSMSGGDVHLEWEGGATATNHVVAREDLADTNAPWQVLFTAPPSIPAVTNFVHTAPTNGVLLYGISSDL